MKRVQKYLVLVTVDLECIENIDNYQQTLRDHIECSFDEGDYIIVDDNIIELNDEDLQAHLEQYKIAKRLTEVTK